MGSILRILGQEIDIDKFDIGWELEPAVIHRKGELKRKYRPEGERITTSQLIFNISEVDYNDLNSQIKETISFLKENLQYLKRLPLDPTIETLALDFAFNSRIDDKNVEVQNDYLPAELIKLAGSLNMEIWLTQWPTDTL